MAVLLCFPSAVAEPAADALMLAELLSSALFRSLNVGGFFDSGVVAASLSKEAAAKVLALFERAQVPHTTASAALATQFERGSAVLHRP